MEHESCGVGVMTQLPHALFAEWVSAQQITLGAPGENAGGVHLAVDYLTEATKAVLVNRYLMRC